MSRRELLIQQYVSHYKRVNSGLLPVPSLQNFADMRLMYGPLIAPLPSGSRVLDVGCGTGMLLSWLARQPGLIPVGVDSSITQTEQARRHLPNTEIVCSDGLSYLREHPRFFAGIWCLDVLEHLPEVDLCLEWVEAAWAALRPGGFFLCRAPNGANLTASYCRYMDLTHERCFTSASLLQLLEAGGFQECRVVPIRTARLTGRLRLALEAVLHRVIFRICGHGLESTFTYNICAVGY
ncbi:MAG: hypothetical protein C4294_07730, partial [Nitrospiraceae bacterium]